MGADKGHKGNIIIKKVKKGHAGAHGGSWKVAYADFVTAMMAFFLLMWLLNMVPQQKLQEVASYFKDYSIFDNPGPSPMPLEAGGLGPPGVIVDSQAERPDGPADADNMLKGKTGAGGEGEAATMEGRIEEQIEQKLPDLEGQITVTEEPGGKVRVEIMDSADKPLFERGSATIAPIGQKILSTLTETLKKENVKVAIEGHTDAYRYGSAVFTNWELSTERALSARKVMERAGLSSANIDMVAGYAETRLYNKENPYDPRNRRISLLLYREPRPGETPAGGAKAGAARNGGRAASGETGAGSVKAPVVKAPPPPSVGDVFERQIDKIYEKSTESQF